LSIPRAGGAAAAHEQRTPGHGSDGAAIGSLEDDGAGGLFDGAPLADQAVQGIDLPRARAAAIEPVRDDWEAARAASLAEANAGRLDRARVEARKFLDGLTDTKVLDPVCFLSPRMNGKNSSIGTAKRPQREYCRFATVKIWA
jgi:hypothetical protein